jgi:PilZ domain
MEKDRRREPRTRGARPVYVRPADPNCKPFEEVRTMRDFSRDGLYFLTELSCYSKGMRLHVIPAFGSLNLEYVAEVVRVERTPSGEYGVALRLLGVKDATGTPQTAAKSAFQSFALAASPIRTTPR